MNEYYPDNWVVIKITPSKKEKHYKILAGWSGGYLDGDSWRVNSGVKRVIDTPKYYDIYGTTDSIYHCRKSGEELRMNISGVYNKWKKLHKDKITIVPIKELLTVFSV